MRPVTINALHYFTGFSLVLAGIMSYEPSDPSMMLSWAIFGAMYISMSDIGESKMTPEEMSTPHYWVRAGAAYFGAILSVWLLITIFS